MPLIGSPNIAPEPAPTPEDALAAPCPDVLTLRGISRVEHHYHEIDADFEFLSAPTAPIVCTAWDYFHQHVARHGRFLKNALSLRDAAPFAHSLWMVEYKPDEDAFFVRLWSSGATELIGANLTGHKVPEDGPVGKWPMLYRKVMKSDKPVVLRNKMSESEKDFLITEVAVLPLHHKAGGVRYMLCPFALV